MYKLLHSPFFYRLSALIRKEFQHMLRDKSTMLIGVFLPMVLILLFGYGLSLDIKNTPVAIALEDPSPTANDIASSFALSPYFAVTTVSSMQEAQKLLNDKKVNSIIRFPNNFSRQYALGQGKIQVILNGTDANTASIVKGYIEATLGVWSQKQLERTQAGKNRGTIGSITVEPRIWFNSANTSTWFLVPGLIVLIMTLVGTFLTSLVVAREWERGTLEALFVTPVRPMEILIAKIIPYLSIGLFGWLLCVLAARFMFAVPIHGSLWILFFCSVLYLLVAVGIGLFISSATKNQFIASQLALISSLLPAMMLSGFLFDLRNVPPFVRMVGQALPATYFMDVTKTLFLAGNIWPLIIKNSLVLMAYALLFLFLARRKTQKRLN
jgi:ABC-2 type transport system permease protein